MFHQYFQPRNMSSYYSIQKKMVHILLEQLVESPDNFFAHIRQFVPFLFCYTDYVGLYCRYVGAIALQAAYGYEVKSENDFYINLAEAAMQTLTVSVHSNYLVDFAPVLKFIPGKLNLYGKGSHWSSIMNNPSRMVSRS